MGNIAFHKETIALPDGSSCIAGKFTGTVDVSTNAEFENVFKDLTNNNFSQLVINLAGLTYISSTGLGVLVRYGQKCREKGGDIKITQVPPSIGTVFRTVGLDHIFEILTTDQQALKSFQEQASYKPVTRQRYPAKFKCPSCSGALELNKPGKYRCPHCGMLFAAEDNGAIKGFITRRPKIIETKISGEMDSIEWIKGVVTSQARWMQFPEAEQTKIEEAIDKTYRLLITHVAKPDTSNYRLVVITGKKELSLGFVVIGATNLSKDEIKATADYQAVQQLTDRIELTPLTPQGLIIKLIKTLKTQA